MEWLMGILWITWIYSQWWSGWWFQMHVFFSIFGMMIPNDEQFFHWDCRSSPHSSGIVLLVSKRITGWGGKKNMGYTMWPLWPLWVVCFDLCMHPAWSSRRYKIRSPGPWRHSVHSVVLVWFCIRIPIVIMFLDVYSSTQWHWIWMYNDVYS